MFGQKGKTNYLCTNKQTNIDMITRKQISVNDKIQDIYDSYWTYEVLTVGSPRRTFDGLVVQLITVRENTGAEEGSRIRREKANITMRFIREEDDFGHPYYKKL